jgi:hypothetical protein
VSDLAELIARLEQATGPSRELDLEIALATGWEWDEVDDPINGRERVLTDGKHYATTPCIYTKSLDVALTLLNGLWCIYAMEEPGVKYLPANASGDFIGAKEIYVPVTSTITIAVCIVALKARATAEGGRDECS